MFSAYSVPRGKPHPDLFLYAAEQMGADPAGCVVVEDTPLGVTAVAVTPTSVRFSMWLGPLSYLFDVVGRELRRSAVFCCSAILIAIVEALPRQACGPAMLSGQPPVENVVPRRPNPAPASIRPSRVASSATWAEG